MFVHIGDDICPLSDKIIGVFDLESATISDITKDFLNTAEKNLEVTYLSEEVPRTFVVALDGAKPDIYLSATQPLTIQRRLGVIEDTKE